MHLNTLSYERAVTVVALIHPMESKNGSLYQDYFFYDWHRCCRKH